MLPQIKVIKKNFPHRNEYYEKDSNLAIRISSDGIVTIFEETSIYLMYMYGDLFFKENLDTYEIDPKIGLQSATLFLKLIHIEPFDMITHEE